MITVLTVALAVTAHAASTAPAPSFLITGVGFLLTWRAGWGLAAMRVTRRRLVGLVVAVQFCLHIAFAMSAQADHHHPARSDAGGPAAGHLDGHGVDLLHGGPLMLGAHLLAAVCLAWWLACGERLLWRAGRRATAATHRLLRRLRRRLALPLPLACDAPSPLVPCRVSVAVGLQLLRHALARRGPPLGLPA
ncbi:hypothetical protein [Parafrankia sp. BMG5.11]|uniref:hypothetical protein n=1 Tax=Parafrankia sp. BMG5.11 TaxID=222540 RepID=UPI001040C967|nr:hypothetical protein [Parafrankia sp. BMG5.11]TCJ32298.1 hypothetical protein E0504_43675 [Parafrankia sp. BMG5.11]